MSLAAVDMLEAGNSARILLGNLAPLLGAEGPLELLIDVLGGQNAPTVAQRCFLVGYFLYSFLFLSAGLDVRVPIKI
jgi:hypothetical protein